MDCPKCKEKLEITPYPYEDPRFQDIDLKCANEHCFFVRIKEEDLIEE